MSVSLYQSGVSGLSAAQQQLATTGNNIANVNTEGYNRQRAEQNASMGLVNGGNFIGTGTYVQDIARIYDEFSYKEQTLTQSNLSSADLFDRRLTQLDQIMSTSGGSVVTSLESFYQAVNGVADNPNDAGLRSIVLNQASGLSNDFNELTDNLEGMTDAINGEIAQVANRISEISYELAKLNETVTHSQGVSGQANEILDKRDQLITELSSYTQVTTLEDQHGVQTVMIGQGTTLVAGITPFTLQVNIGDPDTKQTQVRLVSSAGSTVAIDGEKLGGSLGASFEFRDNDLRQVGAEIDRLAMAISSTLNDSQASGLDLNGLQGANIFTDINSTQLQQGRVLAHASNSSSASGQVEITDVSKLSTDEFEIRFDGTDFTLYNLTKGSNEPLAETAVGSGVYASATDNGFTFAPSGTPAAGDRFSIVPTKNSAALMQTTLTDGNAIAASSAVGVTPSTNNVSDGRVNIVNVIDPVAAQAFTNPPQNTGILVDVYESASGIFSYRIYDADPLSPPPTPPSLVGAITSGNFLSGDSAIVDLPPGTGAFQIEISGKPTGQGVLAPEKFIIDDAFGVGNSSNVVSMAKTQEIGVTNGGKETFGKSLAISTSVVGAKASNASLVADTAQALFTQAYNRNQATSGVNLDEEAANLLKYQQAYQAASQVISTANTLFDTILAAVR